MANLSEPTGIQVSQSKPRKDKTASLLPVRPRPFVGETICSWIIRLASANGLSLGAFANVVLGLRSAEILGIIDAVERPSVIAILESCTSISARTLRECSFYDMQWNIPGVVLEKSGLFFGEMSFRPKRNRYAGLMASGRYRACLACWREDEVPYIRKNWRLSFSTICPIHKVVLSPFCKQCGTSFSASFITFRPRSQKLIENLSVCIKCGTDTGTQFSYTIDDYIEATSTTDISVAMSQTSFDNHLLVQEVLERCFLQGWFSPSDATKLLEMPDCRLAPWNSRQYASLYPRIETEIDRKSVV